MTIATAPAGLAGLTIAHARQFEHDSRVGARRVGWLAGVVRLVFAPVEFICSIIDRQTGRMAEQVVWFNGVRASIEDGLLVESEGVTIADMLAQLERLQQVLSELRPNLLTLQEQTTQLKAQRIAASMRRMTDALTAVYNAVEAARWAVLEYEADADIAAGRVSRPYASAAELMATLRN